MSPSTHDISAYYLEPYLRVAKIVLRAGNRLLIVSKPSVQSATRLASDLAEFKDQIMFRFTIGTTDEATARFWEPGAPAPAERLAALELVFRAGYRTSVSAEPLLGGAETAFAVLEAVRPFISDSIWIGRLNKARQRVDMSNPANAAAVAEIERLQTDDEMLRMVRALDGDPVVRWKDSIKALIGTSVGAAAGGAT